MRGARKLRELLAADDLVVAPGAYDCITARTIAQNGYAAVYMSGAGTAAAMGYPDYGLITFSEMAGNAGRIAAAVDVPVIADADTGFGNELNAVRAVREYEMRGVAAMHIEDQIFPKKCGHLEKKVVAPLEDYVAKIRAAVSAKTDTDFMIIARTDSRAELGMEEAIRRVNTAIAAGADMAFIEAPQTVQEILSVPKLVNGPCMLNLVWNGKTPDMSFDEISKAGYRLVILPGLLVGAVLDLCDHQLNYTRELGRHAPAGPRSPKQIFARFGAEEWDQLGAAARIYVPGEHSKKN
jgi:2-methylisocitrate lyase-like PEP mutase family enzyme